VFSSELRNLLDSLVDKYNRIDFIEHDPVSVPHLFSKKQDIEIAAFFAAIFSWGQRKTIINKSKELLARMDMSPYDFVLGHSELDLKKIMGFKHRTFNDSDALYFIHFLKHHYQQYESLEEAFMLGKNIVNQPTIEQHLIYFKEYFFHSNESLDRTKKHISSPISKSTCKRLCMFLRWLVRDDDKGVDLGLWKRIKSSQLVCPVDIHVYNTSVQLGLIKSEKVNWNTALELTEVLKSFDSKDPVKYDFALFGLGIEQKDLFNNTTIYF
jgi:uncharacterized protein (TIGR02757 family)